GRELAHPVLQVFHQVSQVLDHVEGDLGLRLDHALHRRAVPEQKLARLSRLGCDRILLSGKKSDASKHLAGLHKAEQHLPPVGGELGQLDLAGDQKVKKRGGLILPEADLLPLEPAPPRRLQDPLEPLFIQAHEKLRLSQALEDELILRPRLVTIRQVFFQAARLLTLLAPALFHGQPSRCLPVSRRTLPLCFGAKTGIFLYSNLYLRVRPVTSSTLLVVTGDRSLLERSSSMAARHFDRILPIAAGIAALAAGLWTSFARLGFTAEGINSLHHGPLMVGGFVGTIIALE